MASAVAMYHQYHRPPPPSSTSDCNKDNSHPAAARMRGAAARQSPPPPKTRGRYLPRHRPRHADSDSDDDGTGRPNLPKRSFSREEWELSIALIQRIQEQEEQRRREQEEIDIRLALKLIDESARQEEKDEEFARALASEEDHTRRRRSCPQDDDEDHDHDHDFCCCHQESESSYEQQLQRDMEFARSILDESHQRRSRLCGGCQYPPKPLEDVLKPCQLRAVRFVQERAQEMHENALPTLMVRVVDMGFTPEDLETCLNYIRDDAPIVVHVSPDTIPKLVEDTHYRNLFEVHTSGGCKDKTKRLRWESTMFGDCYDEQECLPTDRPKYGCLNVTGDLGGVRSAYRYGNCYMTLNEHVRQRATFFDKDTGGFVAERTLATNEHYAHILNGYNDFDLQAAMNVACNSRIGGARSWCSVYKEVQIHGPVCLSTDIQALTLPGREVDATIEFRQAVLEFQNKTGCNILWQMDLLEPEE